MQSKVVPPVYFLASILLMVALHLVLPIARLIQAPWSYAGAGLILVGIVVTASSARLFQKYQTAIKPFEESSALVVEGPFKYTRNPMYLGMLLILLGMAMLMGTATPFVVIPVFAWLITTQFIVKEEEILERRFGHEYLDYRTKVRRWF